MAGNEIARIQRGLPTPRAVQSALGHLFAHLGTQGLHCGTFQRRNFFPVGTIQPGSLIEILTSVKPGRFIPHGLRGFGKRGEGKSQGACGKPCKNLLVVSVSALLQRPNANPARSFVNTRSWAAG